MTRERVYVLQDPSSAQAVQFLRAFDVSCGLRAVCLWTDDAARRAFAWEFPELRSPRVAAHLRSEPFDLGATADVLADRYDVAAVVPWQEPKVAPAVELAATLGLSWAQPEVMGLFRDKYRLKAFLRGRAGGPRINAVAAVASPDDVEWVLAGAPFDRFVLKPNDGYGNIDVGFFDRGDGLGPVRDYLARTAGRTVVMEEFVGGDEFYVNGQVDARGTITVTRVCRYLRGEANGKPNVEFGTRLVRRTDPRFAALRDYAVSVVAATGLRRSPFHLEAKVDDRGPCLIEVGMRIMGGDPADEEGRVHGGRLDVFEVAAHYYLTDDDYGPLPLDWDRYDALAFGRAEGVASSSGRIYELRGVHAVESMPEFVRWSIRPRVGDPVVPTVDLGAVPWNVTLEAPTDEALDDAADRTRTLIGWNDRSHGLRRAVRRLLALGPGVRRVVRRRWHERSTRPTVVVRPGAGPAGVPGQGAGGTGTPASVAQAATSEAT